MRRRDFLVAAAGLAAACGRPAERVTIAADTAVAWPHLAAPLVLVDAGGPGGFGRYLAEMLAAEGVLGLSVVDPAAEAPAVLAGASGIVVYGAGLPAPWLDAVDGAVRRGATLLAVAPGSSLLTRVGIDDRGPLPAGGVRLTHRSDGSPLRLHVSGRRWTVGRGARTLASFDEGAAGPAAPAAVTLAHGSGSVTVWAFDVARNVACIRQGNPEWTGSNRDAFPPQQLIDAMTGWIRPETLARPDADLYQQALSATLAGGTRPSGPHPLLDYFPAGARSILVATSDAHAVGGAALEGLLRRVEGAGGRLSVYYMPNPPASGWRQTARQLRRSAARLPLVGGMIGGATPPPTPDQVAAWRGRGHEFAPIPTSTTRAWTSTPGSSGRGAGSPTRATAATTCRRGRTASCGAAGPAPRTRSGGSASA
jgi:hypothetical protein